MMTAIQGGAIGWPASAIALATDVHVCRNSDVGNCLCRPTMPASGWTASWRRSCPTSAARGCRQLIGQGAVTLDGADDKRRQPPGQTGRDLRHRRARRRAGARRAARISRSAVVYEDKDLIVIDKPAGLVVHPAAGNPDGTLVNALIAHCGDSLIGIGGEARPGIVHRLDKDTSGLLVAAKTERAMASLAKQFANHTIERAYHAVVWGSPRTARRRHRRPDRPQPLRPQAHGGAARRRQAGAHPLSACWRSSARRSGPSPR